MGRGGAVPCPTCRSSRTKTALGRRVYRARALTDGGILRAHKCLDCERLFLTVQRVLDDAEAVEPLAV